MSREFLPGFGGHEWSRVLTGPGDLETGTEEGDAGEVEAGVGVVDGGAFDKGEFGVDPTLDDGGCVGGAEFDAAHGGVEELEEEHFGGSGWGVADEEFAVDFVLCGLLGGEDGVDAGVGLGLVGEGPGVWVTVSGSGAGSSSVVHGGVGFGFGIGVYGIVIVMILCYCE